MGNLRPISEGEALEISRDNEAFYSGHFVGTQGEQIGLGLHMPEYFDSRTLVTIPTAIEELAQGIAHDLDEFDIETIVGMPLGALTLGHEVAKALNCKYVMAEKRPDGSLVIARSAFVNLVDGRRIGAIEDTINEGTTLLRGVDAIRRVGGIVVAAGGIINRGTLTSEQLGAPLRTLIARRMASVTYQACLQDGQCARGEPINRRPGHGHDFEQLIVDGVVPADSRYSFV